MHIRSRQPLAAPTPVAALDLFQHYQRVRPQRLAFNGHHRVSQLLHNLLLLRLGKHSLNHLHFNQWHVRFLSYLVISAFVEAENHYGGNRWDKLDSESVVLARASVIAKGDLSMDALLEVLKVVQIESAFFYNGEFTAPWGFNSPESCKFAPFLRQPAGHVIVYHLLTEGHAIARLDENTRVPLEAGDIVIFPHGNAHCIENGPAPRPVDGESALQRIFERGLKLSHMGGGGELTRFVCGYMVCEPRLSDALLSALPSMFKVNVRNDESGRWLEDSIRFSMSQAATDDFGARAVLAKLCEALFAETLRRYAAESPDHTGWLAAARDPEIGRVLTVMHRQPAAPWTLASLATQAGLSRSVLAERFREFIGEPPLSYLTRWRLQLAARLLTTTTQSASRVAAEVGYDSEAAFNRAFKRQFGHPPARYRAQQKAAAASA